MRTDGVDMAPEAIQGARHYIENKYGSPYLPRTPRLYQSKAKNAQEAHEAIRPTDTVSYTHLDVYKRQGFGCGYQKRNY